MRATAEPIGANDSNNDYSGKGMPLASGHALTSESAATSEKGSAVLCPNCGNEIQPDQDTCASCGAPVTPSSADAPNPESSVSAPNDILLPAPGFLPDPEPAPAPVTEPAPVPEIQPMPAVELAVLGPDAGIIGAAMLS